MTEEEKEPMERYGITVEQKSVYFYKGYKYDRLNDALNYAKMGTGARHDRLRPRLDGAHCPNEVIQHTEQFRTQFPEPTLCQIKSETLTGDLENFASHGTERVRYYKHVAFYQPHQDQLDFL